MLAKSCFSRKIKCKFTPKRAAAQLPLFLVLTYTHFTLRKPRINPTKSVRRCESYVVILSLLWRLFFFFFFFFVFLALIANRMDQTVIHILVEPSDLGENGTLANI